MASKKAAAKKPTSIVKWDEKFAGYAKDAKNQTKNIGTGGIGVRFNRGSISIGDTPVKGGKLECVIIGSCAVNKYYKTAYSPDDKQSPDCYAFALVSDDPEMAPSPAATDKQSVACADCEHNQFGTALQGRGKRCGNTIRLGLLLATDVEDAADVAAAELATGSVSPTNQVHYKKYVDLLEEEHGRPPWAVVTEITSHDDPKTQIRLEFRMVALVEDDDVITALEKRFLKVQDVLQRPFAAPTEKKPAVKAGGSQRFAAKKGVKAKK